MENAFKNSENKIKKSKLNTGFEDSQLEKTDALVDMLNKIQDDMWNEKGIDLDVVGWWAHIQEPNMSTNLHAHRGDEKQPIDIGGVYYPHDAHEDSGEIVFQWPDLRMKWGKELKSFKPEKGMYLLFPCHLDHWVTRNTSDENRVSISFNMEITNKESIGKWELL